MKRTAFVVVILVFVLTLVAAHADHPYSADRDRGSTRSYYGERQTRDGHGFRPYQRPVRYSTQQHERRYDYDRDRNRDHRVVRPGYCVYEQPSMIVYENSWLSYGALGRPLHATYPYVETVPVVRPCYDYYYQPRHDRGRGHHRPGLSLDLGGITIIIRP